MFWARHLQELQLIVEVVLKPQNHAAKIGVHGQAAIACGQLKFDRGNLAAAGTGQILDTGSRKLFKRLGERHRTLMQHVAPRQDFRAGQRAPKQFSRSIAIGDDEISHRAHPRPL